MTRGDFNSGVARLQDALQTLENAWINTKEQWNDRTAERFEKDHLQPIIPNINATITAVSRIKQVLDEASRDCGDGEKRVHL